MADTVKTASELSINYGFYDGDTHQYKLPNPRANLTAAEVKAAAQVAITNSAFIGDKTGAAIVSYLGAKAVSKTVTQLDLTQA